MNPSILRGDFNHELQDQFYIIGEINGAKRNLGVLPGCHFRVAYRCSRVMERISPALIWITPCSDSNEKLPEASFCVICPSIGLGNRPASGRRVTLTRSPTARALNAFVNDSNIAIAPPKRTFFTKPHHFGTMLRHAALTRSGCEIALFNEPPSGQIGCSLVIGPAAYSFDISDHDVVVRRDVRF
jgi:hypothetical protein